MVADPKIDWTSDYDIFDKDYIKNPFPIWEEMRGKCPVAHTDRWGGSWNPTTYDDVFAMAQDTQHFSSTQPLVAPIGAGSDVSAYDPTTDAFENVGAPPISSDPPEHTWSRRLLLPVFSIRSIEKFEPLTRDHCNDLIDKFIGKGTADGAVDYAQQIPPYVIAAMLGIPREMKDTFTEWVRNFLELGLLNLENAVEARTNILTFLWAQLEQRKANPDNFDDLLSYLVKSKVDGQPVPDMHILGTSFLILVAGIDTTWSSIGSALWHLAQNPQDRKRLIDDPDILPTAVEELLRAYSPVTMGRVVMEDVDYNGCPMKTGDKLLMNFPAANRDPNKFKDADKVIIDRAENPHIAFGAGIHRCAGSNLARMEMRIAIETFLKRIPDFELANPSEVTWAGGQVRGPRTMQIKFPVVK